MKYKTTIALASLALLSACEKKSAHHAGDGHDHEDHIAHNHAAHDHGAHEHDENCDHDHEHESHAGHAHTQAGPNHGRLLADFTPQAEFLVRDDRSVQITFFDADMKPVAPSGQIISVISGERSAPVELNFTNTDGAALVSDKALPEGNNFPTIVAIKANADAEEVISKFTLNLSDCSGCSNKEYACECHH